MRVRDKKIKNGGPTRSVGYIGSAPKRTASKRMVPVSPIEVQQRLFSIIRTSVELYVLLNLKGMCVFRYD